MSQSNCLLSRLGHYSPGAKEAAQCRAFAKHREENVSRDRLAHHEAHIRGRSLQNISVIRIELIANIKLRNRSTRLSTI